MHIPEGDLRAYYDAELPDGQHQSVAAHLAQCTACQERGRDIQQRAWKISDRLEALSTIPQAGYTLLGPARRKFEDQLITSRKERYSMKRQLNRVPRGAWIGLALLAVLAVALAFPSVQAVANSFLGLFRVEQIQVVDFNPESVPGDIQNSKQMEALFSKNIKTEGGGEPQALANADAARSLSSLPVRLPEGLAGAQSFSVRPESTSTFTVDLALLRSVLKDMQRTDIVLPDSLDGAQVQINVPTMVIAKYGACAEQTAAGETDQGSRHMRPVDCTTLIQGRSPTISAPPDLDMVKLGQAYLQLLGMSPAEAQSFAAQVDWASTLIVPLPRNEAEHSQVTVDGVTGTLVTSNAYDDQNFALLWVKDGILYALAGNGDSAKALEIASTLK